MSQRRRLNTHSLLFSSVLTYSSVAAFAVSLLSGGPAAASSKGKQRQAREDSARSACLDGDYNGGVAILTKLFVETKDITYIFNQGRCLEQNRRYEEAIARFQEYLRAGRKTLEEGDKAEAEQRVAECREMLAQEHGTAPPPTAPQPALTPALPEPSRTEPTPPQSPAVNVAAQESAPKSSGAGLRTGGIVLAAVGLAAVGAGVVFNLKANAMVNDMYKTQDGYTKESDRKTYVALGWIGYGAGAACVVTGAIVYGLGLHAQRSSASDVAVIPALGAGQAGVLLRGAF